MDALVGRLEELLGAAYALGQEPLERSLASDRSEQPGEVAWAGVRVAGEVGDGQRLIEPLLRPAEELGQHVVT